MVVGQHGLHGLGAHLSVILGFRLENVSVVLPPLCTEAAAVWDLIYKPETATLSPAQVSLSLFEHIALRVVLIVLLGFVLCVCVGSGGWGGVHDGIVVSTFPTQL